MCSSDLRSLSEVRVAFVPGGAFHPDGSGRNTLRLSFTLATDRAVDDGIPRLAALIRSEMGDGARAFPKIGAAAAVL